MAETNDESSGLRHDYIVKYQLCLRLLAAQHESIMLIDKIYTLNLNPKSCEKKLCYLEFSTEDVKNFMMCPTTQMFKCFPIKKRIQLIKDALQNDLNDVDKVANHFVKVSNGVKEDPDAINTCTDAILGTALSSSSIQEGKLANSILVFLGFLKSEDKIQPVKDLTGPLSALQHAAKQEYFTKSLASYFIVFMSRPTKVLEQYSSQRHSLLQALYQV